LIGLNFQKIGEVEFILVDGQKISIQNEGDVLDLIGNCGSVRNVLIHQNNLSPNFFDLSSGFAGIFMQKFANYSMRCAVIVDPSQIKSKRFHELIYEHNRSSFFRFFSNREDADEWLKENG
jgi:hypothetical protein